jgi:Est1-like DNA/RNA binding protein
MAVEDEDPKDREIWANVARYWYCKAADKMPNVGRLYHHLAILARGNPLQQLYLYSRSLTSALPFHSARESIQSLLAPAINDENMYVPEVDAKFVKCHASLFYRKFDVFDQTMGKFTSLLDPQINKLTAKWREYGVYIAASNIGTLFDFGHRNELLQLFEIGNFLSNSTTSLGSEPDQQAHLQKLQEPIVMDEQAKQSFELALKLFFKTLIVVLQRPYDKNCQPFLHVTFAFLQTLLSFRRFWDQLPEPSKYIIRLFLERTPWQLITNCCNTSIKLEEFGSRFESLEFLQPEKSGESSCLPEDYLLWGMVFTQTYYPSNHFAHAMTDEERSIELPSTMHMRGERNLHVAFKIARENVRLV